MGQSGRVGSHTVKVCLREAKAMVRPACACREGGVEAHGAGHSVGGRAGSMPVKRRGDARSSQPRSTNDESAPSRRVMSSRAGGGIDRCPRSVTTLPNNSTRLITDRYGRENASSWRIRVPRRRRRRTSGAASSSLNSTPCPEAVSILPRVECPFRGSLLPGTLNRRMSTFGNLPLEVRRAEVQVAVNSAADQCSRVRNAFGRLR